MTHTSPRVVGSAAWLFAICSLAGLLGAGLLFSDRGDGVLAAERSETKPAAVKPAADKEASDDAGPAKTKDTTFDDVKLEMKKGDPFTKSLLTDKVKKGEVVWPSVG